MGYVFCCVLIAFFSHQGDTQTEAASENMNIAGTSKHQHKQQGF